MAADLETPTARDDAPRRSDHRRADDGRHRRAARPRPRRGTRSRHGRPGDGRARGRPSRGLEKRYGDVVAVAGVDLEIADGEFFSMLGPSGSGKTTTLRMIAGFELPTAGRVFLDGRDVTRLAPFERDVNTVFQDYALFPHMTVGDNVGYGLIMRKVPKAERERRVGDALADGPPRGLRAAQAGQLSGGQRQRVALARALVNRPRVLLLDEPLGALDLKLREEMQIELKEIQHEVGITFIYVTHDQEEALTMSDRIAVFNRGRIEQVGTPAEVYERPATAFVAGFVGTSNLLVGRRRPSASSAEPGRSPSGPRRSSSRTRATRPRGGRRRLVAATGRIRDVVYLGPDTRYFVALDAGGELVVTQQNLATSSTEVLAQQGRRCASSGSGSTSGIAEA